MVDHKYCRGHIAPTLLLGAAIVASTSQAAFAQAFTAAKSSLSHYSKTTVAPGMSCDWLNQYTTPDLVQIKAATVKAAAGVPAHCRVVGVLKPEIAFEVSLPQHWNGRFYMIVNGGHGGEPLEDPMPVAQRDAAGRLRVAQVARYTGKRSSDQTANFRCITPQT